MHLLSRRTVLLAPFADEPYVITVRGRVPARELGLTLPHEHVMSTFGSDPAERAVYDQAKLFAAVLPHLERVRALGCRTIADATAAWFGRHPALLQEISRRSGLHIVTNSGYYGAADDRYVPPHAHTGTADELAARWVREWRDGIDGTRIRPGFLKIGVDAPGLSPIDRKLVTAAARTHKQTGLTIAVHTGDNPTGAAEQLAILRAEGVSPRAWIWVHAHGCKSEDALLEAAQAGAWLSFDGLDDSSLDTHLRLVRLAKRHARLGQVLLSHDGNSFRPLGGPPRAYEALFTAFIPMLAKGGFSGEEIHMLTHSNPAAAFAIRKRPAA